MISGTNIRADLGCNSRSQRNNDSLALRVRCSLESYDDFALCAPDASEVVFMLL